MFVVKIADRVYLVGSGKYGMELSDPMDCNVYLLDGGDECALIDVGGGVDPERIVHQVEACGFSMGQVRYGLLTHVHADHAAGARYFHDRYGVKMIVAEEAAVWLAQGDMDKTSFNQASAGGVYPPGFQYPACPVERGIKEGDTVRVGELELAVLETPGHSRGHVSYVWRAADGTLGLFAGDTVFAGGKVVLQYVWDCVISDYAETIAKLHRLGLERLYPGHGPFLLSRASEHVAKAHACFSRLELPPNL